MTETSFEKQWRQAERDSVLYMDTLLTLLQDHPNIGMFSVHDSINLEGPEEERLLVLKEAEEQFKKEKEDPTT